MQLFSLHKTMQVLLTVLQRMSAKGMKRYARTWKVMHQVSELLWDSGTKQGSIPVKWIILLHS